MLTLLLSMIEDPRERSRFERIYHSYRQQMFWVAENILEDPMEAEDAVQNALLSLAQAIAKVPDRDPRVERAYVLTVAKHAALRLLQLKRRRDNMLDISELALEGGVDTFDEVQEKLNIDFLKDCIQQLPEHYRDVLALVCIQQLSYKEVAVSLRRKESTVRKQFERGRKQLAELCRKGGMSFEK